MFNLRSHMFMFDWQSRFRHFLNENCMDNYVDSDRSISQKKDLTNCEVNAPPTRLVFVSFGTTKHSVSSKSFLLKIRKKISVSPSGVVLFLLRLNLHRILTF